MKKMLMTAVLAPLAMYSATAFSASTVDEAALGYCGKAIAKEVGVSRYTTFDKNVGMDRMEDGTKRYYINSTYRHPKSNETKHFRSFCDANGFKVSTVTVLEGAWEFSGSETLNEQVAAIGF